MCGNDDASDRLASAHYELMDTVIALSRLPVAGRTTKVDDAIEKMLGLAYETSPLFTLTKMCREQISTELPTKRGEFYNSTHNNSNICMHVYI